MRIAVASWSRRHAGGAETYLEHVLPALCAVGHDVAYWYETEQPASARPIVLPPRLQVRAIADSVSDALSWRPDVIVVNGLLNDALEARLLSAAPSLFVAHSFAGTCISGRKTWSAPVERPCARRFGPPCLLHYFPHRCGGRNPLTMVSLYGRERRRLLALAGARRIVTLSHFMREEYLKHGFAADAVVCVPYGPPAALSSATRPVKVGGTLVFVGRLDRLKGVHVLLDALPDAARRLGRSLTLSVVGDGPERQALERQASLLAGSAVNVRFEGWLLPEARDAQLRAADLLVVPSLWPEPFGLVGVEAARLGVPSVGFDVGGIRDWLVHGETGLLAAADPPEASALAATIADALRDPGRLSAMGRRAAAVATAGPTPVTHATELAGLLASIVAQPTAH